MKLDLTDAVGRLLEDTYKEAYIAGLRRAQELAKERAKATWLFRDVVIPFVAGLKEAIDAEVAKEGK